MFSRYLVLPALVVQLLDSWPQVQFKPCLPLILDLGYCCFNNRASRYQRHTNHKPFLHYHFWQNQSVVWYLTTFIFFHIPLKKHWAPLHVLCRRTSYKELLPQVLDLFSLIILRKPKYIVCYFPRLHLQSNYDLEAQVADYCLPHPCFTMHFVHWCTWAPRWPCYPATRHPKGKGNTSNCQHCTHPLGTESAPHLRVL